MKKNLNFIESIFKYHFRIVIFCFFLGSFLFLQSCEKRTEKKIIIYSPKPEIKKLIKKGDYFFGTTKNDSAFLYYTKALFLCNPKTVYAEDYVLALSRIANIQKNSSDYYASEETLTKALPYLKYVKNTEITSTVYTLIAYNYYYSFDYKNATVYHLKALKSAKTSYQKSVILNDIILIYLSQERYNEAAELLVPLVAKKIKHITDARKTDNTYSLLLDNLGYCYCKLENPKAVTYLNESLQIKLKQKDHYGLIGTYNTLSLFYANTDLKLSKMYAEEAYKSAKRVNAGIYKANGLAVLIQKSEGDELKKYALDFIKLIDSFVNARQKAKNEFSRIKYDSGIDRVENLHLKALKIENELQLEKQKKRNIISYVVIFLTTGISLILYCYLMLKGRKEKDKAIFESEMRISKKLHDELANDVYNTLTFTKSTDLRQEENKEQLLHNLEAIYSRTRNISKENSSIATDRNYSNALKEMIAGYKTADLNIILTGFDLISWNEIEKNKKIILYRILQELFSNMKKHSQATLVSVTFKNMEKNLTILYNDNGVGAGNRITILKNGLQNVENRIKTINGNIIFGNNSEKGFRLNFSFPL